MASQRTLVLRFASDYEADCAIFSPGQLIGFINGYSISGYAVFSGQFGTKPENLGPGSYCIGIRNGADAANSYSMELDNDIQVPATVNESCQFEDIYIQCNDYVAVSGGKLWHAFTIQSGFRYFLDGCNTGLDVYIISENQLAAFRSGSSFNYYSDYSGQDDSSLPGLSELKLPPGNYCLAVPNPHGISRPITYTMERWRILADSGGSKLDLAGPASWKIKGAKLRINVGKVVNKAQVGSSGSLRLRLWAVRSPFSGGSLSGFVLGVKRLSSLAGGDQYSDLASWVPLWRPPGGRYYTVLTLEEYTLSGWVRQDCLSFSGRSLF